jgi:hypothetical protein
VDSGEETQSGYLKDVHSMEGLGDDSKVGKFSFGISETTFEFAPADESVRLVSTGVSQFS